MFNPHNLHKFLPESIAVTAVALAVLPTLVIHANYLIAASEGFVPWCNPYWDSCTSISATGRQGTAFYYFKVTMLPLALLYWRYWLQASARLQLLGHDGQGIRILGTIAVLALIAYVSALGIVGDTWQLTRRIGIILFFTFTYLCQLLIVYRLERLAAPDSTRTWQKGLLLLILAIGVLTLFLDALLENYSDYEDAFEWVIALLLHLNILLAAPGWHLRDQIYVG